MEYDEYIRQEEAARKEKKKKTIQWVVIGSFFLTIGTCNFIINTKDEESVRKTEEDIYAAPAPGDRFVFNVKEKARVYKLKAVTKDSMEFLIPMYDTDRWNDKKSKSKFYELESAGKMYDSSLTMFLPKEKVLNLRTNRSIYLPPLNESAQLQTVFGPSRTKE